MDEGRLTSALNRADSALERIESALANSRPSNGRDEQLRTKVREAVAELDQLIRESVR